MSQTSPPSFTPSRRVAEVQNPVIPNVVALMAAHPGTISLGQGMVAYGPPESARRALAESWDDLDTHRYGRVAGSPALRETLADKLRRDNGITDGGITDGGIADGDKAIDPERVLVTAGSNMAFLQAILAIADPGDDVILPVPFYFNHEMAIELAGCRASLVPTGDDYQPDPAILEAAIGPRTRAIVTISPNNPTGAVYSEDCLAAINALCRRRGLFHISDEAYEYFTWDGARHVSPASLPGADGHTLSLFSLSKAYGFAGWRIGYAVIPEQLRPDWVKIQDTNLICPVQVSERVALAALGEGREYCRGHLRALEPVRRALIDGLAGLGSRVRRCSSAAGAMYVFVELDSPLDSETLVERLVREHRVGALPGGTFGVETCSLRISYGALEADTAQEGIRRLIGGLREILG